MLYANGCSFTYGTGLADKSKAWPFELAERLGLDRTETVTEAQRGVSNQYIVRNTITTVSDLLAEGKKPFCAVGLTAPSRREHFIEATNTLIHNVPAHEYHGNIMLDEQTNRDIDLFNTLYMKHFWSPVYDFHQYLIHMLTLQNFFKNAGLEYVIFNSLNLTPNLLEATKFTELCEQADMNNVLSQLDMTRVYEQQTFFTYMHDNELYFKTEGDERYMHPDEQAHADWADILLEDINKTRAGEG
ncbi:hypothetical protein N8344_01060 [bacterium]|nr:hypothetical protein [bacterium]